MSFIEDLTRTSIGVDIGVRRIKAVQLRRSSRRIEALAAFPRSRPLAPIDRDEIRHLHGVLRRQGFGGQNVVLGVPAPALMTSILEMPPRTSGAPVDRIASMELSRIHKCEADSFEMSCWDLPPTARVKGSAHVMAVAYPRDDANVLIDLFEDEGFGVRALDVPICALARACETMLASDGAVTGILDLGWSSSFLVMLFGGVIVYERNITETGMASLFRTIERKFPLDGEKTERLLAETGLVPGPEDSQARDPLYEPLRGTVAKHFDMLAEELRAPFSYMLQEYSPEGAERLLLVGGGASVPGVAEYFASVLELDTRTVAPVDLVECPPSLSGKCADPALTTALGLARFTGS